MSEIIGILPRNYQKSQSAIIRLCHLYRYIKISSSLLLGTSNTSTLAFLGQEDSLDVRQNSSLGDGHPRHQLVEVFIIPDSQLQVAGDDARFLVVPGSVPSQLQDLGGQVLHHSGHVDRCARAHPLSVVALPEEPVDSPHWEL